VAVVKIGLGPEAAGNFIPPDFIGFGYEKSAVAVSGYFDAKNATLVQLYRSLSPHGLVRVGGNISDHAIFVAKGTAAARPQTGTTVVNRDSLLAFAGFLEATGWKAMWGLNLGTGSKKQAVEEAAAVSAALGDRLESFEIGNEVDLLPRFKGDFAAYHAAYLEYKAAIRAVLPTAAFSGPDVTARSAWPSRFADAESADLSLLTQHYYRDNARNPTATIAELLAGDPAWEAKLQLLERIGRDHGLAYRINEVNSFSGGGKAGVSDTFASALWCLDYMFVLASHGCAGINLETDINQFGWISHYSPIFRDEAGRLAARPSYYGMLAFAMAAKGRLMKVAMDEAGINLTAYATRDPRGTLRLTVVNKDLDRDAEVVVELPKGYSIGGAVRLRAPAADNRDRVTLAGAEVGANGNWLGRSEEQVGGENGAADLPVPRTSAAILRLSPKR
jgi:hypothetical protein